MRFDLVDFVVVLEKYGISSALKNFFDIPARLGATFDIIAGHCRMGDIERLETRNQKRNDKAIKLLHNRMKFFAKILKR